MRRSRPGGRRTDSSLTSGEDFQAVYRVGSRHVSAVATIYVLPRERAEVRLGVPAGRRLGRAVARNRLRRRIREALARIRPTITAGADIVVVPQSVSVNAPFSELVDTLFRALVTAGLIRSGVPAADHVGNQTVPKA